MPKYKTNIKMILPDITTNDFTCNKFFDLGEIPLVNNLEDTFENSLECKKFPLSLVYFEQSKLTRLSNIVNPELLFDNYLYYSGVSKPYIDHCQNIYDYLNSYLSFKKNDLVVDIGGNDGSLLLKFKENNLNLDLINIEPSNISKTSQKNQIKTIKSYFDSAAVSLISKPPKAIITTNVFQHVFDINSFAKNIYNLLDNEGIWCLEFPYWLKTMDTLQFDQIYHEHIYYYNFTPLYNFLNKLGFKVINVTEHDIHAGSLRLLIAKNNSKYKIDSTIDNFLEYEKNKDLNFYFNWSKQIENHVDYCKKNILELSSNIAGFGAAAKGCTFLNYAKLDYTNINYVIDDTTRKQDRYIPGTGLKIHNRNVLIQNQPEYVLILAHNFKDYIIKSLKESGYKNKFIICFPKFEIIN